MACRAWWAAWRVVVLALLVWPGLAARAGTDDAARGIAVLYPDIGEPYRSVFTTIIQGIEDRTKGHVPSLAVGSSFSAQDIAAELRRRDVRAVIALGRNGLKVASALDRSAFGVVAGGVLSVPESEAQSFSVHSLAPDPGLLFMRLKGLMPGVRRVAVVYDPRQNGWLIKLAREAARAQGLELTALEADDLKAAVRHYQDLLGSADAKRDALWLPQDSTTVEDTAVLPLVLRESWNQNLPVFSSSLGHVKRGVLFALYPDNQELGRALAGWALGYVSAGTAAPRGILPLRDVLMAVNARTANHLGINLGATQQRFHMVFPEP